MEKIDMKNLIKAAATVLLIAGLYGCGGSSDSATILAPHKTTLAFTAISTAALGSSISGIELNVVLPSGMSVSTSSGTQIASSSLLPGTALPASATTIIYGSYSASSRKAQLTMGTTGDSYRSGEFLRLVCNVDYATTVTINDLRALNPVMLTNAFGYDSGGNSTQLTNKVRVRLDLVP